MSDLESLILDLMQPHKGREHSIEIEDLSSECGLNERKARDIIADLRLQGYPIISLGDGYFYAADDAETKEFVRRERSRAFSILTGIKGIDPKTHQLMTQMEMNYEG